MSQRGSDAEPSADAGSAGTGDDATAASIDAVPANVGGTATDASPVDAGAGAAGAGVPADTAASPADDTATAHDDTDAPPPLEPVTEAAPAPAAGPAAARGNAQRRGKRLPDGRIDVTGDLGVVKAITTEATEGAATPEGGGEVTFRYSARLARNDFQFDHSPGQPVGSGPVAEQYDGEDGTTVTMARDMLVTGLERAVASMAVGEIATFTVLPAYGYGAEGSPDGQVPPNATLTYHVELVEAHPRPKSLYEMTDEERLAVAIERRADGNNLYSAKQYSEAAAAYDAAWVHLDRIMQPTPDQRRQVSPLKVTVQLNLAIVKLKLGMYRDVIEHCNEVLRREAGNVKALFRRSKAYEQVGDLRAALSDAKEAAAKEPDNVHVQRRVSRLRSVKAAQTKKLQKAYGKAFTDSSNDAAGASGTSGASLYPDKPVPASARRGTVATLLGYVRAVLWLVCSPLRWLLRRAVAWPAVHFVLSLLARWCSRIPVLGWAGAWVLNAALGPILAHRSVGAAKRRGEGSSAAPGARASGTGTG